MMWLLAFSIYGGCKWLTWRRTCLHGVTRGRQIGYLLAWPGMDADAFLNPGRQAHRPGVGEWWFALAKLILGLALLSGAARHVPGSYPYLVGWVGMIGLVLALHFGTFHLLSCAWRQLGVEARPLMNWPLAAVSVSEFWGRRWNTAFRDLTHRFLLRPLAPRLGPRRALLVGFVISGLIHDLVISVPAEGGYGRPTLFFILQGMAIFAERSPIGRLIGLGNGWQGWLFTMAVLLVPVCLLFHPPFVVGVIVPLLHVLRADR